MRRRTLLAVIGAGVGVGSTGCQRLVRDGQVVRDRGCSGAILDETNLPPARVRIRTWYNPFDDDITEQFPRVGDPPAITFGASGERVVIRVRLNGDNDDRSMPRSAISCRRNYVIYTSADEKTGGAQY